MARTGRFGRQPRSAPSLTNTLIAIAREFQNQRAQNIMDAWQKGGTFEGKKATDEEVLKFWREKTKGVSKDDPLHDTYQNAYTQLDYSIHESKMTAAYAQGKASDGQMVSFYLNWAKKVPKDSEFYRVLQRDAGQYMRNQRAKGEAEAKRRAEEAYQRQQADTRKQKEGAGEYVIDTLRRIAQSGYADGGIAPAIGAPGSGSDLTDFDPTDPDTMLKLIGAIVPGSIDGPKGDEKMGYGANTDVIYHDDDGKAITGVDIMNQLRSLDGGFKAGAPFDVNYVTGLMDRQLQGLNERIARATKTGHMQDVAGLLKSKEYVALLNREVAAYPVQKAYQEARSDYDSVVGDKSSSPQAVLNAWNTYQSTLLHLADDPRIQADDNMRSRLTAEANGDAAMPTLNESFTGLASAAYDPSSAKDSGENAKAIEFMQEQVDAVAAGEAFWTYGQTNANGVFEPRAGGREIGAATPDAVESGGVNAQVITVPDARGGKPLQMLVTATPVFASARDPNTGEFLSPSSANPVAYAYDVPKGSGTATMYGFQTVEGFVFSSDPPWDDRLKTTASSKGGNHIEVDLTPVVEQMYGEIDQFTGRPKNAFDLSKDRDLGNGFKIVDSQAAGARGAAAKPGALVFDPQAATWHTDTRNGLGSTDPMSDYKSLTLGLLMTDQEGQNIVSNLDKNPAFKTQLDNDAATYSGMQRDPKTGAWVPGTGDPAKLAAAQGQQNMAQNSRSIMDFLRVAGDSWQRNMTGSPFKPTDVGNSSQNGALPGLTANGFAKLATDLVKGTPFEALGNVFLPGTSTVKPYNDKAKDDIFRIKPVGTIKAPTLPSPSMPVVSQGPIPNPTAPTAPPQTGSTAPQGGSKPPSSQYTIPKSGQGSVAY